MGSSPIISKNFHPQMDMKGDITHFYPLLGPPCWHRGHRAADSPQDLVRSEARFAALEPSVLQLREELEGMRKMRLGNETEECGHFILDIYGISMVYLWKLYLWYIYGIYR